MNVPLHVTGSTPRGVRPLMVTLTFVVLILALLVTHSFALAATPTGSATNQAISVVTGGTSFAADGEYVGGEVAPDWCEGSCTPTCLAEESCAAVFSVDIPTIDPQTSTFVRQLSLVKAKLGLASPVFWISSISPASHSILRI